MRGVRSGLRCVISPVACRRRPGGRAGFSAFRACQGVAQPHVRTDALGLAGRQPQPVGHAGQRAEVGQAGRFVLSQGALGRLREGFASSCADRAATIAAIADQAARNGLVIDPHTAAGIAAAAENRGDPAIPMITLGTAHAAKFPDAVEEASGIRPALPPRMADLHERPERLTTLPNDLGALEAHIRGARRP